MKGTVDSRNDVSRQSLTVIQEITRLLDRPLDQARVVRGILRLLSQMLGLNRGRVCMPDGAGAELMIRYTYGLTHACMAQNAGLEAKHGNVAGFVMRTGTIGLVTDAGHEPMALIAVPILASGRTAGVLVVQRTTRHHGNFDSDIAILRVAASAIGQVIRARRPDEYRNMPTPDTGAQGVTAPQTSVSRPYQWVHHDDARQIRDALAHARGNQAMAARMLNMTARQLRYRILKLGIRVERH